MCSVVNSFAGHFETAIIQVENSLSLSPFDPMRFSGELAMAYSQYFLEHYDLTAEAAQRCVQINSRFLPGFSILVASRISSGQIEATQTAIDQLIDLEPYFRAREFIGIGRFSPELNEKYSAALRKAGLPGW